MYQKSRISKGFRTALIVAILASAMVSFPACTKKVGCDANIQNQDPMNSKKKHKTKTFLMDPKKTKKRG